MNRSVFIRSRQRLKPVDPPTLRRLATTLLHDELSVGGYDLGIYIVRTPEMIRLNETHLRHKGSTDVITFDYSDGQTPDSRFQISTSRIPNSASHIPNPKSRLSLNSQRPIHRSLGEGGSTLNPCIHGEIFICIDEAIAQARRFRTTWRSELARYVIHGVLHLCGYDDLRPAARRTMKREESRLLQTLSRRFALSRRARGPRVSP